MSESRRRYVAYLLRLWQVRCGDGLAWRASLERADGGERRGFASPEALFAFLRRQMASGQATGEGAAAEQDEDRGADVSGSREENT